MICSDCRFTPCTVAQGVSCCYECEFKCSSMCERTRLKLIKERENIMKVGQKNTEIERNIKVTRAHQFEDGGIAFDMEVNGVTIYGCKIATGKKGEFVSFPSRKGKDGKYYSYAYCPLTEDQTKDILSQLEKM